MRKKEKELIDFIEAKKRTKGHGSRTSIIRGLNKPLPPDYGCPECNKLGFHVPMKISSNSVTCTNCGLKYSLEEYYDYIELFVGESIP